MIRSIIEGFVPEFAPGSLLLCAGGVPGSLDEVKLSELGVTAERHGELPDVVLYVPEKDRLFLVESGTSHGPVDEKRRAELSELFAGSAADLVYITAFPSRSVMADYVEEIAWETNAWVADSPTHMIHLDGSRVMGPYARV